MKNRRILSLWFPRLEAERLLRQARGTLDAPLAVVRDAGNMQVLCSLSEPAARAGLRIGQPLRDARAMCPDLLTRAANPPALAATLSALRRLMGQYSPWIAEDPPNALMLDLSGCTHLFGGEAPLLAQVHSDCAGLGLTVQSGIADTVGAAWALARFAGQSDGGQRSGDAIDQEARATRSRAAKRRNWERGGAAPTARAAIETGPASETAPGPIAPRGQTRQALAALPIAALRLPADDVTALSRLGLRRIDDLAGQPRAALARRFGAGVVQRLDQAFGLAPEPVAPHAAETGFALRLSLPDPIGLQSDVVAALDRLLPRLQDKLTRAGRGARTLRLQILRCDHQSREFEIGLARPSADPDRIRPLLLLKLPELDAGPGIDTLRLEATRTEALHAKQHKGHMDAAHDAGARQHDTNALDDLVGRLGARVGQDALIRLHPGDSHIPEKAWVQMAAAWSAPAPHWPPPPRPRPVEIWRPELVLQVPSDPRPPPSFRWRRQDYVQAHALGPERISPEWWLDDPEWRNGVRDYWTVTTACGRRLWLYYAHGGIMSGGWFCQGAFS